MIKKLFLIFTMLMLSYPCFADNQKQKEDEAFIREIINSPSARLSKHQMSLKQDFELYKQGNEHTIYAQIIKLESMYKNSDDKINKLNNKYIELTKNLYLYTINTPNEKSYSEDFYNGFENKKVIIPDKDYDKLDENLKNIIPCINVYY